MTCSDAHLALNGKKESPGTESISVDFERGIKYRECMKFAIVFQHLLCG